MQLGHCRTLLILMLSGLSLALPVAVPAAPVGQDLLHAGQAEVAGRDGMVYGHGTGETEPGAYQEALRDVAEQLLLAVRGQTEWQVSQGDRRGASQKARLATRTYINVELQGVRRDAVRHRDGAVYVRVALTEREMVRLRRLAVRKAPALAVASRLKRIPSEELVARYRQAVAGLESAERRGVLDERLATEAGPMTFRDYFSERARGALERMRVVVGQHGDHWRVAVFQRETLAPVAGLPIQVQGMATRTDGSGRARVANRGGPPVTIRTQAGAASGAPGHLATVREADLSREWAPLFVHTEPGSVPVRITGGGRPERQFTTPARIKAVPGGEFTLRMGPLPEHAAVSETVAAPERTTGVYRTVTLPERRTGRIRLRVEGGDALIRLIGPKGRHEGVGELALAHADTGSYRVRIVRRPVAEHQTLEDQFFLEEGQTVERVYQEPVNRDFTRNGLTMGVSLWQVGMSPGPDLTFADGGTYQELEERARLKRPHDDSVGMEGPNIDLRLFADTLNVMVHADYGNATQEYTAEWETTDGEVLRRDAGRLKVERLSLGGGFYKASRDMTTMGWISGGMTWKRVRWDDIQTLNGDFRRQPDLPEGTRLNREAFVEVGARMWFVHAYYRHNLDNRITSHFEVGLHIPWFQTDYRYSAEKQAQQGRDYRIAP